MKVKLRNPDREVMIGGGRPVGSVLDELGIVADTVLVIRAGELITQETSVRDDDELEIRPVISGGAP
ncbi:MAG: MoaD/ThiS family protein [Actinomycetota bacterium]|nr:MoaD/ThiS family protein [Actinomycetota bacterium]